MATYLIEKNTEFDYTQIGTMVNRDRSNVYNSLKRAKELLETNADFWFLSIPGIMYGFIYRNLQGLVVVRLHLTLGSVSLVQQCAPTP